MDELDKLNEIFKSGDIALGIQLIKSLDLELYDVLLELYHKFKYFHVTVDTYETLVWWVLDNNDPLEVDVHCIRFIEGDCPSFTFWYGIANGKESNNIEDCITELTRVLKENYG